MSVSKDDRIKSRLIEVDQPGRPLIVCIHGGGCNAEYFDLPHFSFREQAIARSYPLLLLNRPGHGGSDPAIGRDFNMAAQAMLEHIHNVVARRDNLEWVLLGHSIGAAMAIIIAGDLRPSTLCAVAISGIGDRPTPAAIEWARGIEDESADPGLAADLLFGPQSSFSWRAPKALRHSAEAWRATEVEETLTSWPQRIAFSAQPIDVPVFFRLAEMERIWETGQQAVERIGGLFISSPCVDTGLLPDGGHLYEVHHRGRQLMSSQLDFFDRFTGIAKIS